MELTNLSKDGKKAIKEQIYPKLQHGDLRLIEAKTTFSYTYIRNVLSPESISWNEGVVKAALDLIEQREIADKALIDKAA